MSEPENLSAEAEIGARRKFLNLKFVLIGFGFLTRFVPEKQAGLGEERRAKD